MMDTPVTLRALAQFDRFPPEVAEVVQTALTTRPEVRAHLAQSPALTDAAWLLLWGPKTPDKEVMYHLVDRPLIGTPRQIVIEREKRSTVISNFLLYNELSAGELRRLAVKPSAGTARVLLGERHLDPELRRPLALKAEGRALFEELAFGALENFSDDEVFELLVQLNAKRLKTFQYRGSGLLRLVTGRRPAIHRRLLEASFPDAEAELAVHRAVAGSGVTSETAELIAGFNEGRCTFSADTRRRKFYILVELLENPRTPAYVATAIRTQCETLKSSAHISRLAAHRSSAGFVSGFSTTADPDEIMTAIHYALRYPRQPRPLELFELLGNPHLPGHHREVLEEALTYVPYPLLESCRAQLTAAGVTIPDPPQRRRHLPRVRAPQDPEVVELINHAVHCLGTSRQHWETLIALLPEFDGPFDELVAVTMSLC
jgi:hypothetical protein